MHGNVCHVQLDISARAIGRCNLVLQEPLATALAHLHVSLAENRQLAERCRQSAPAYVQDIMGLEELMKPIRFRHLVKRATTAPEDRLIDSNAHLVLSRMKRNRAVALCGIPARLESMCSRKAPAHQTESVRAVEVASFLTRPTHCNAHR